MPRIIQIAVPANHSDDVISLAEKHEGLIGLSLQKGASLKPPGDIVTLQITNRSLHDFMRLVSENGFGQNPGSSIITNEVSSIISAPSNDEIVKDSAEATWEEMEIMIAKEGNMTLNAMLIMLLAGVMAGVGIVNSTLHLVIAAMVIAPGFEPLVRISLSLASRSRTWRRGFVDTGKAYAALFVGGLLGVLAMQWSGVSAGSSYLERGALVTYWSTINAASLLISAIGGTAGAILVATNRSVLTAGVMIALALVPTPVIVALGLIEGDYELVANGGLRWLVEVMVVLVMSGAVFLWKQARIQRRQILW